MPAPGEVHWIPRRAHEGEDPKDRRHVLAHACASRDLVSASFLYASTQTTQKGFGVPCVTIHGRIHDTPDGQKANGFSEMTHIYPSVIASISSGQLATPEASLSPDELKQVRDAVSDAIGKGQGTVYSNRRAARPMLPDGRRRKSLRGLVATFASELAQYLESDAEAESIRFGVIISRHDVSAHPDAYQTIVPVIGGFEPFDPDEIGVCVKEEPWIRFLRDDVEAQTAVFLVPETFYVHPSALRRCKYEWVVSPELMWRIENQLVARLSRDDIPAWELVEDEVTIVDDV